ncbi:MAG: ribonuclease R, partial [Proteobacteria bacterium]|nr:ribonuclease R [Pseudomonadota bacterium]
MTRKRSPQHTKKPKHSSQPRENNQEREEMFEHNLLTLLYNSAEPLRSKDILQQLNLAHSAGKTLHNLLIDLTKKKILKETDKQCYRLGPKHGLAEGILDQNARGFGFVTALMSKVNPPNYSKDPFVSPGNIQSARHGDRVLIRVFKVKKDGRPEAEVISILQRGRDHLAGFVTKESGKFIVTPEDHRYPFSILLTGKIPETLQDGDAVIVQITGERAGANRQQGTLVEILGDPDSVDVQMRLVIEKFSLPHEFSEETLQQTEAISEEIVPSANRLDLREIDHITIDGETAKDFDDAIAVKKTRSGFRLYVSIADVSHYVKPGSALDKDAYQRGTSVYFPGRVIPMLPEKLSNGLCSLVPNKDRYAFTAILDFDRRGHLKGKQFTKSIICSKNRFTYTTVRQIIVDRDPAIRKLYKPFLTPLKWAEELATLLMHIREQRGSIGFTIPEPFISLDEEGKIKSISRSERNFAHQLIEEFMLAANEAVAETFTEQHLEGLYRIHERPAPEKVEEFVEFTRTLGLELPPLRQDPDWFGQVLGLVKGSPKEYVIN